nr:immunoglobulin heavy chain junction region [Mus musculus]
CARTGPYWYFDVW